MTLALDHSDQQIVNLLQQGCSNGEIAAGAGVSESGVKKSLSRLYIRAGIVGGRQRVRLLGLIDGSGVAAKNELPPALSGTERSIAKFAISGLTNGEIAERRGTSEQVVKNHLRAIFDKCGVWTRTELAARFR